MSLQRFKNYKNSSVTWLGEVPTHWQLKRLRFVVRLNPSKIETAELSRNTEVSFLPMEAVGDDGTISLGHTRTIGEVETGYTYFRDGDVAFAKITPCFENGKGAVMRGLLGGIGFGTTELTVVRPLPSETTSEYLHWLFTSTLFRKRGEASMYGAGGQKRVSEDFVRDFAIAFPPVKEQQIIAAFLARETTTIDALIVEQRRLIDLLKEKRQGVISQSVTKGLDPSAPLTDSGVEWLGTVPAHWQVVRLGSLFREAADPGNDDLPLLSVSIHHGVSDREFDDDELDRKVARSDDRTKYKCVQVGDLVYNMMRAWQGGFGTVAVPGMVSPAYVVARPITPIRTELVEQLLRTPTAVEELRRHSHGVTDFRLRLYWDEFKTIKVAIPPPEEQRDVLAFLDRETAKFDALTAEAEIAINLLQERRTALISAAVTGKIDVRGLVTSSREQEVAA
jgi:type I restriction enzyme S subunit